MNSFIDRCCICGGKVREVFSLDFEDIVGMAHEYTQHLAICDKCGFVFTQNPFSEMQLENRYKNESKFEFDDVNHVQNENPEYVFRCNRIKKFIEECTEGFDSVFEVGAASGYNLGLYSKSRMTYGVEPSRVNCRLAKTNYDVDLFCGTYREFDCLNHEERYDLVFLSMILEHIVDPYSFIKSLKKYNTRYMFIEVPTLEIKNVEEPFGMFCEEHVNMFTLESLNNLMNSLGYGMVDARLEYGFTKGYPAGWPAIDTLWEVGRSTIKFEPTIGSGFLIDKYIERNNEALKEVRDRIDMIPDDLPIAIWGTGHHVSMLLRNTGLGDKNIIKFYDSDSRKYKYTVHGKSIMKFDPDDITSGIIRGIVIGTYIFQEVLSEIIIDSCGEKANIIRLYNK